ncbi:MAG TPA: hypothetical protein EYP59_07620 [Thiotrichaceae bacterium]|nr:hypothetical protein [Thiotrichaceae bacterium]
MTVVQGEPENSVITAAGRESFVPSPLKTKPTSAISTHDNQNPLKIFLFTDTPAANVKTPTSGNAAKSKKESMPPSSIREDSAISAPDKRESAKIFLFTDTSTKSVNNQESASATQLTREQTPLPPSKTAPSDTAAPTKKKARKNFLFTDSPAVNAKKPDPNLATRPNKSPTPSPSLNLADDKSDSKLIDTALLINQAKTSPKNNIRSEEKSGFYFTNSPPKGFEHLSAPQTTEVDIYLGNELLTSAMARYDLTSIEFINPQEITALLTQLKEPAAIISAISGPLNPHTEDVCLNKLQQKCGVLEPSIAEIIFDTDRFRVDLFINPLYLSEQTYQSQMFLPAPQDDLSSVNIFTARVSGGDKLEQRSHLTSNNIISYGSTRLHTQTRLDNSDGFILESANLEHDRNKWNYAIGTMESTSYVSSLVTTKGFLGLRVARSLKTRTDLRLSRANEIFIFFNERSYVEIIRDGRVLASGFYEPGNQQLDTSSLSEGVYNITVRISNSRGEELQTHLFSRSSVLPPQDHALHFIEAGMLVKNNNLNRINKAPKVSDVSFIHAGTRMRITDRFGADLEVLNGSKNTAFIQAGLYYFMPGLSLHGGALGGSQQTQGKFFDLLYSHQLFSLGLTHRGIETHQEEITGSFKTSTTTGLTLGARILGGSLTARATETNNARIAKSTDYSLTYRRSLFSRGRSRAYLTLDWKNSHGEDTVAMGLQFTSSNDTHSKYLATRWSDNGEDSMLQTEGRFTRFHRNNGSLYGSSTVSARTEKGQQNLGLHLKGESRFGSGFLETQHKHGNNNSNTTYSAGTQAIVVTGASAIASGGGRFGRAGIIVDLNGRSKEDFEVFVNNSNKGIANSNRNQPILLPPYKSYDVTLRSKGDNLDRFDAKPRTVTLYPGNVVHLQWDVNPVFVVIGQAVYADGKPVENTRITNLEEFSGTDENGWFQVELTKKQTLELALGDGLVCNIKLPKLSENENVVVFDQLICDPKIHTSSSDY